MSTSSGNSQETQMANKYRQGHSILLVISEVHHLVKWFIHSDRKFQKGIVMEGRTFIPHL